MLLSGAEIVIECLKEQHVDTVFGYPGNSILGIYDQLFLHSDEITHILTSHEQGAAHAADGYARATGKPGVVIATSGPGSTNLVTGIATAYMDSVPVIAITCNVALSSLGKDSFQEIDIAGITMPITKHNFIVKDVNTLAHTIRMAFKIAQSGRPGPVLIDIPKDITSAKCEYTKKRPEKIQPLREYNESDIMRAADIINKSISPAIIAGGGIISSGASVLLKRISELLNAPVCCTLMGIGSVSTNYKLFAGMAGTNGTASSRNCIANCDLLIACGTRFSDHMMYDANQFAPNAKLLHLDIDAAEINKNIRSYLSVTGDISCILSELIPLLEQKADNPLLKYIDKRRNPISGFSPRAILTQVQKFAPNAIFTTEVGQNQILAARCLNIRRPRTFLTSGGLGTMGFGLGAAIGAAIGTGKTVVDISGDGSFYMNMNEIKTAVDYNLPVKIIIMNNGVLGMVRQWQKIMYKGRYFQTTLSQKANFALIAQAMGAHGYTVSNLEELISALDSAFNIAGPCVIDCRLETDSTSIPINV